MGILQVYVKVKNVKFTFRWFYTAGNFTLILIPVNWSTRGTDLCDWEASLSSSSSWSQVKKNYIKKLAIFSFDLRSHSVTLRCTSLLLCLFIYSSWQWCQVRITFNWIVYLCIADKLSRPFGDGRKSNTPPLAIIRERCWWKIRDYIKCLHIKRKAKCKTEKQTKGMSTAKQKWRVNIARTSPRESKQISGGFVLPPCLFVNTPNTKNVKLYRLFHRICFHHQSSFPMRNKLFKNLSKVVRHLLM